MVYFFFMHVTDQMEPFGNRTGLMVQFPISANCESRPPVWFLKRIELDRESMTLNKNPLTQIRFFPNAFPSVPLGPRANQGWCHVRSRKEELCTRRQSIPSREWERERAPSTLHMPKGEKEQGIAYAIQRIDSLPLFIRTTCPHFYWLFFLATNTFLSNFPTRQHGEECADGR